MVSEKTEGQFSAFCRDKGYFRLKLQIDKSKQDSEGKVIAKAMPSDFLVVMPTQIKFVEVKEVLKSDRFSNSRFRQQYKLTKLSRHYPKLKIMAGHLLINFVKHNVVVYFEINEYNQFLQSIGKQSFKFEEVPAKNRFDWKTLSL